MHPRSRADGRLARAVSLTVLVSLAPVFVHASAFAQPAAQDDALTKRARARFQEGVEAFDKGQWENARLSFTEAYALKKHPAVLLNLAQSCLRGGHAGEAARYFQQFLREATTASPAQKADAEKGLADARTKGGRVDVSAPAGTEILLATANGDVKIGTAPLADAVDVDAGTSTLKGRAADGSVESASVTVAAGQRTTAKLGPQSAAPVPVPPPVPPTTDPPKTDPPKTDPPKTDPSMNPPPPDAPPGEAKPGLFSPPKTMTPVYIGAGLGVLGLAGTIIFAASKASAQSAADDNVAVIRAAAAKRGLSSQGICGSSPPADFRDACTKLSENNSAVDTNATLANVSVVVMVVGFVGAGAWYLFAPKRDAAPPAAGNIFKIRNDATLVPLITTQGGGLLLTQPF